MAKYRCWFAETTYGSIDVEASEEVEARQQVYERHERGDHLGCDSEDFNVFSVEPLDPEED